MSTFFDPLVEVVQRSDPVLRGAGLPIAVTLLLMVVLFVPLGERRYAREPFRFLAIHLVVLPILWLVPVKHPAGDLLELLALATLLASIGGSAFALFVHSLWMRKVSQPLPKILRDVIKAFIYAGVLLLVLRSAGVEPGSLLATSAFLTAVIGLSLQDTLGNLFAGLAIQAQRPFGVGDWVEFDKQTGHIGKVIEINWRATRVLTLQRLEVTVPNASVAKSPIINFSRPTALVRRDLEIHAPYSSSPESVRTVLLGAIEHVPEVLQSPPPTVLTKDFTERGVNYWVLYYIDQFQDREIIDSNVRERLWYAMQRAGLMIPVPRLQLDVKRETATNKARAFATDHTSVEHLLSQVDLFTAVPEDRRKEIARGCRRRVYATEEVIVHRGDLSTDMYLIERGRVRIELLSDQATPRVVAELGEGEFFGEMSLMTGEERTADVIAMTETAVLVISRDLLAPVIEAHPEVTEHVSRILTERQHALSELPEQEEEDRKSSHDQFEVLRRIRKFFR